jgi:hypothetical protein
MRRWVILALLILAAVVLVGCAKPPADVVQQARSALQAAEAAGAPEHAPAAWDRAKQAAERLEAELARQEHRWKLLRRYGLARSLAEQAATAAKQALAEASTKSSQLRAEIGKTIEDLKGLLLSARSQLSRLPGSAGVDRVQLRSSLDAAGRALDQAQADMDGGRFDAAQRNASQARDRITAVLRALEKQAGRPSSKKR